MKDECVLNHDQHGRGVYRCGQVATHLIQYSTWPKPLPACQALASEAIDNGAHVVSRDALVHAGLAS